MLEKLSKELNISLKQVESVLSLFSEGCTVPFIARYRKEATGNLDEVQILDIKNRNQYWIDFDKRKLAIIASLKEQDKYSQEIKAKIEGANSLVELEDIYAPFKQKRLTKGQKAIKAGLKGLALLIKQEEFDFKIDKEIERFLNKDITTEKDAIAGAIHVLSEWIADDEKLRSRIRDQFERFATISAKIKKGKDEEAAKYKDYFNYSERIERLAAHRTLAILRAEKEGFLKVQIDVDKDRAIENIDRAVGRFYADNSYRDKVYQEAYKRCLQPTFESEIKRSIKEQADNESIKVFAENLRQLLFQSPLGAKPMLAIDPGYRTGCKVAVLSASGEYLENRTIFPHAPQKKSKEAAQVLRNLAESHKVEAIAVGNGTAGLETEKLCRSIFKTSDIQVFSVNEAGASIYSASSIAREEFPTLDVTVRGAISIGRRLMDPLAELVKIDPKSIGVGQYQHDVNQTQLKNSLDEVVEHCVNHVGVELNTASFPILSHVSGLSLNLAKNIVNYRNDIGGFTERKQLMDVPKMGKKTFEQAAGFLRIEKGKNPLDNTIIHPESYKIAKEILKSANVEISELGKKSIDLDDSVIATLKEKHGEFTVDQILKELQRPTRDPRSPLKESRYNDIESLEDLMPGMKLNGTVNNITNFGAFIDVGIKESGLVHISELANEYVSDVQAYVTLNQQVSVKVLSVDKERRRLQLSMK
ncbi:MAG: Tex family protein [Crocinitomicaceae bacterium]